MCTVSRSTVSYRPRYPARAAAAVWCERRRGTDRMAPVAGSRARVRLVGGRQRRSNYRRRRCPGGRIPSHRAAVVALAAATPTRPMPISRRWLHVRARPPVARRSISEPRGEYITTTASREKYTSRIIYHTTIIRVYYSVTYMCVRIYIHTVIYNIICLHLCLFFVAQKDKKKKIKNRWHAFFSPHVPRTR